MPNDKVRNVAVGLTLVVALIVLGAGIFMLGTFTSLIKGSPYLVTVISNNANGLNPDSKVDLNGVVVGTIKDLQLEDNAHQVRIILAIDHGTKIPGNVVAEIQRPATIGATYLTLRVPNESTTLPDLAQDDKAVIHSAKSDSGLIPQNLVDSLVLLSNNLTVVSNDLHSLLQQRNVADVDKADPQHPLANISTLVERLDRVAKSLDKLVGDPQLQEQVKQLVANLAIASQDLKQIIHDASGTLAAANTTIAKIGAAGDQLGGAATQARVTLADADTLFNSANHKILPIADKLVDVLSTLQLTLTAITEGKGTAGRFVQDPRLYEGLVDVANELKGTIDDLHALVREIRENGVGIHLGGAK